MRVTIRDFDSTGKTGYKDMFNSREVEAFRTLLNRTIAQADSFFDKRYQAEEVIQAAAKLRAYLNTHFPSNKETEDVD